MQDEVGPTQPYMSLKSKIDVEATWKRILERREQLARGVDICAEKSEKFGALESSNICDKSAPGQNQLSKDDLITIVDDSDDNADGGNDDVLEYNSQNPQIINTNVQSTQMLNKKDQSDMGITHAFADRSEKGSNSNDQDSPSNFSETSNQVCQCGHLQYS